MGGPRFQNALDCAKYLTSPPQELGVSRGYNDGQEWLTIMNSGWSVIGNS